MKIGIIGAGSIGGTLTRRLTTLGHDVFVANSRGPDSLRDLAVETGAKPVTVHEAARSGKVVIVTIQEKNIPQLPSDLFKGVPENVVVVDTGNYYPRQRDGRIDGIENGLLESRWVEQQLHRSVVKAFNNQRQRGQSSNLDRYSYDPGEVPNGDKSAVGRPRLSLGIGTTIDLSRRAPRGPVYKACCPNDTIIVLL